MWDHRSLTGIEAMTLAWKWGVLNTGSPGKSHRIIFHTTIKYTHIYICMCVCSVASVMFDSLQHYGLGEGNGTPLQYSCLENLMDGGPWWAAVHGVAGSRARLSDFTLTFHFHALEKEMATHSCSCLENSRDRGAWWASIYGVAQSRTRLKRLSNSSSSMPSIWPCFFFLDSSWCQDLTLFNLLLVDLIWLLLLHVLLFTHLIFFP